MMEGEHDRHQEAGENIPGLCSFATGSATWGLGTSLDHLGGSHQHSFT